MKSDIEAQTKRPPMLKRLNRPTKPAAAVAETRPWKRSWIIGDACSRMPMPAVTFAHRMIHSSQNCGVREAVFTSTLFAEINTDVVALGTHPSGFHPTRGTRIVKTPNIMKTKYRSPIVTQVSAIGCAEAL